MQEKVQHPNQQGSKPAPPKGTEFASKVGHCVMEKPSLEGEEHQALVIMVKADLFMGSLDVQRKAHPVSPSVCMIKCCTYVIHCW